MTSESKGAEVVSEVLIPGVTQEEYFNLLLDHEFLQHEAGYVGLKVMELLEKEEKGDFIYTKIREIPDAEVPYAAQWYLGSDHLEYIVREKIDVKDCSLTLVVEPPFFKDSVEVTGEIRIVKVNDTDCKQILKTWLKLNFFGGSLVEGLLVKQLGGSLERVPEAIADWRKKQAEKK